MITKKEELKRLKEILRNTELRTKTTIFETENKTNANIIKSIYDPLIASQKCNMQVVSEELKRFLPNLERITPNNNMDITPDLLLPEQNGEYYSSLTNISKSRPSLYEKEGKVTIDCHYDEYSSYRIRLLLIEKSEMLKKLIDSEKNNPLNRQYIFPLDNEYYDSLFLNKSFISAYSDLFYGMDEDLSLCYSFDNIEYFNLSSRNKKNSDSSFGDVIKKIYDHFLIDYDNLPNFIKSPTIELTEQLKDNKAYSLSKKL